MRLNAAFFDSIDRKQAYKRCAARIDPLGADD
jgi:hypothetical protein